MSLNPYFRIIPGLSFPATKSCPFDFTMYNSNNKSSYMTSRGESDDPLSMEEFMHI